MMHIHVFLFTVVSAGASGLCILYHIQTETIFPLN